MNDYISYLDFVDSLTSVGTSISPEMSISTSPAEDDIMVLNVYTVKEEMNVW